MPATASASPTSSATSGTRASAAVMIRRRVRSRPSSPPNSATGGSYPSISGGSAEPSATYGQVRHHRVEWTGHPVEQVGAHELHVQSKPRAVLAGDRQGILAHVDADHRQVGALVLQGEGDRTAPGPDIRDTRAPCSSVSPISTSSSVSGLGISTRRSTDSVIRRNALCPRM